MNRLRRFAIPALAVLFAALFFAVWRVQTAQRAAAARPPAESPRLVALSPGLTETLCMLGLRDHLVGRTAWCDEPASVADLPVVFDGTGVDALRAAGPDFVVLPAPLADSPLHGALEKARLNHLAVKTDPLDALLQGVFELGVRFGAAEEAEAWLERVAGVFDRERDRVAVAASAAGRAPTVLFVMGDAAGGALRVAGRQAWQSGVVEAIGAANAVTNEAVSALLPRAAAAALRPDVVVEVRPAAEESPAGLEAAFRAWAGTPFPALLSGDWHVLFDSAPLRPGPRVDVLAQTLGDFVSAWADNRAAAAVPHPAEP